MACEKMTKVSSCPNTTEEWDAAEDIKDCSSRDCPTGVYHCVPDDKGNLVEVCTPPKLFLGKYNRLHMKKIFNKTLTLYMTNMNSK